VTEEWRSCPRNVIYEVSSLGRVRSRDHMKWSGNAGFTDVKGRVLKNSRSGNGYLMVSLGYGQKIAVHILVLEAFVGPRPLGKFCLHRNDDKDDNRLDNLYYGTRSENNEDTYTNGIRRREDNSIRARKAMVTRYKLGIGICRKPLEYDL